MTGEARIDDLAEAVQMLATAVNELTLALGDRAGLADAAVGARRLADAAERITERVLIDR